MNATHKIRSKIALSITLITIFFLTTNFTARDLELIKEKSFEVEPGQLLNVKTDIGDIIIKAWSENKVVVKIYGDEDARRKMEFMFDQDENGVEIIGEKEGSKLFGWFSNIELKYEIKVPAHFDSDLKSSGGDMVVKNVKGECNLKTSGGDIYTKNVEGALYCGTSGGDISLFNFSGNAEVSTSGGDIEVDSEEGSILATTSGGDIIVKASDGEVKAKTSGGDISLNYFGENYGISLSTSGGDIDAKLPSDLNAEVDIRTSGGDIISNFSQNKMTKISKSKLIGKYNNGGNPLICKTTGGDISILER